MSETTAGLEQLTDKIIRGWLVGHVQMEGVESRLSSHIHEMTENQNHFSVRNSSA